MMNTVSE